MKLTIASLLFALLTFAGHAAADAPPVELLPPTEKDAAWLAKARTAYALTTCLVSGEELGGMGQPAEYVCRQPGQPDRLVRFCCRMCGPKFRKDPAKYLARLDAADKSKGQPAPPPKP